MSGSVEAGLVGRERVVYRGRVHAIIYTRAVLAACVAIACFSVPSFVPNPPDFVSWAGWAIASIAAGLWFWAYLVIRTSDFAVTDRRVIIQVGIFKRSSLELFLTKVEGISIKQGIVGRVFNFGDISIRGGGGVQEDFSTIAAPYRFRKFVQSHADESNAGATAAAAAATAL